MKEIRLNFSGSWAMEEALMSAFLHQMKAGV